MKLSGRQLLARYEAFTEAADHLEQCGWSEDSDELEQGMVVVRELRRRALSCLQRLRALEAADVARGTATSPTNT